jgi:hypothetical protein|tara:strand:- start:140 stop:301 length:162 start_codon:yes stop_codon:yes gene_type:complete
MDKTVASPLLWEQTTRFADKSPLKDLLLALSAVGNTGQLISEFLNVKNTFRQP